MGKVSFLLMRDAHSQFCNKNKDIERFYTMLALYGFLSAVQNEQFLTYVIDIIRYLIFR